MHIVILYSSASIRNHHIRNIRANSILKHQKHQKKQDCEQGVD